MGRRASLGYVASFFAGMAAYELQRPSLVKEAERLHREKLADMRHQMAEPDTREREYVTITPEIVAPDAQNSSAPLPLGKRSYAVERGPSEVVTWFDPKTGKSGHTPPLHRIFRARRVG